MATLHGKYYCGVVRVMLNALVCSMAQYFEMPHGMEYSAQYVPNAGSLVQEYFHF